MYFPVPIPRLLLSSVLTFIERFRIREGSHIECISGTFEQSIKIQRRQKHENVR